MSVFTDLKNGLIRKIATSFLLRAIDGHKTTIMRIVQGISMTLTGLILTAGGVDDASGTAIVPVLDGVNSQWILALNFLGSLGLEFALQDKAAKARLDK
jgi:hypothetical protein